jgi:hypothetical protein
VLFQENKHCFGEESIALNINLLLEPGVNYETFSPDRQKSEAQPKPPLSPLIAVRTNALVGVSLS